MIQRNDPCWCGSKKKWKNCHIPLAEPKNFEDQAAFYLKTYGIILKTPQQVEKIRKACLLSSQILDAVCALAQEGITTEELDNFAQKLHREAGATPASLGYGYPPFPKSICTSLNEVICHGIPNKTPLKQGDIVNIDLASILDGFYGDCSRMVCIGPVDEEKKKVVRVSYECLMRSIAVLKPGLPVYAIGDAIETYAATQGCSVVNQFVGHGVGVDYHEPPQIPHHFNSISIPLAEGMIFTIEPMINAGRREAVIDATDSWTARTIDGKPSAQWEHTIAITANGFEILTNWEKPIFYTETS
jgi:methionyl aminopeptidase